MANTPAIQQLRYPFQAKFIKEKDLGIIPLLISLPFLYYPKILPGDTQLWVLTAALFTLVTYRTHCFIKKPDYLLYGVVCLCVLVYIPRSISTYEVARYLYTFLAFSVFWAICRRGGDEYFTLAVKWTILIWFLVGAFQYLLVKLGHQAEFTGRYVEGRGGVPSLAAEPSFYGSLSVIQMMYLLSDKNKLSKLFVLLAFLSILLSGSMLAMLLLIFPLVKIMQLSRWGAMPVLVAIIAITAISYIFIDPPARIVTFLSNDIYVSGSLQDPSINLRAGHIYFTLYESLPESLLLINSIDYQVQYNEFVSQTSLFVETRSNSILCSLGELVYGSGIFGVTLAGILLYKVQRQCRSLSDKIIRVTFILACLLNPIHISNVFLIAYSLKRE